MSCDSQTTSTSTEPPAAVPEGFAEVRGRVDVGPLLTLPLLPLLAAAVGASVAVGLVGWGVVVVAGGAGVVGVWLGAVAVALAHGAGLVAMRPWQARRLGRWPFVWLIGRGVSFGVVLALAVLLYSAARPSPLPFGLVIASGYFAALMAEVAVYASHVRSLPRLESE